MEQYELVYMETLTLIYENITSEQAKAVAVVLMDEWCHVGEMRRAARWLENEYLGDF